MSARRKLFRTNDRSVDQRASFDSVEQLESLIVELVQPHLERAFVAGYQAALTGAIQ
jgi:hypothetical protein